MNVFANIVDDDDDSVLSDYEEFIMAVMRAQLLGSTKMSVGTRRLNADPEVHGKGNENYASGFVVSVDNAPEGHLKRDWPSVEFVFSQEGFLLDIQPNLSETEYERQSNNVADEFVLTDFDDVVER